LRLQQGVDGAAFRFEADVKKARHKPVLLSKEIPGKASDKKKNKNKKGQCDRSECRFRVYE